MMEHKSFLAPYIEAFIRYREASGHWNDSSYAINLLMFDRHCSRRFKGAFSLTQEMVDSWCRKRDTEENNSCRSRIYVVVGLVRYLRERTLTDVRVPEIPRKERRVYIPHAFTQDELGRFFDACDSLKAQPPNPPVISRKYTVPVFFRLLYSCGIRTTEARLLKREDVDLEGGILNIRYSKGHNQHYIVLHETMLVLMRQYDARIGTLYPDRAYFFPARNNSCHRRAWVQKNFRRIWDSANPESYATAYEFRHHYAIENINQWVCMGFSFHDKLLYLSKSMGHTTIESTKYYYSLVPGLSGLMEEMTKEGFNWIIPEVDDEESPR